jgi:hypothetical protein
MVSFLYQTPGRFARCEWSRSVRKYDGTSVRWEQGEGELAISKLEFRSSKWTQRGGDESEKRGTGKTEKGDQEDSE